MWEKRYKVFEPIRKKGNVRIYSVVDLYKALKIGLLVQNGHKASSLSALTNDELEERIDRLKDDHTNRQNAVNDMVLSMYRLDIEHFEHILQHCFITWATDIVFSDIIYRFLEKTGLLWQGNRLTEEHFVVTALRSKIIRCIEQVEIYGKKEIKVLLFLPMAGQVDLMLLYTMYQFKTKGIHVLYMGHDVSINNLKTAIQLKQPDYIFTYLPKRTSFKVNELSSILYDLVPNARFIIANTESQAMKVHSNNVIYLGYTDALSFVHN